MARITKFYLDKASYLVGEGHSIALLVVDYRDNKFSYSGKNGKQVGRIARDLLKRKHNVNFVGKIRV